MNGGLRLLNRTFGAFTGPLLIALAILLVASASASKASADSRKRVLLLFSLRQDSPSDDSAEKNFINSLREGLNGQLDYYTEYIDEPRFSDPEYQAALRDFIRHKYAGQRLDLIITVQRPALAFVTQYGSELFPNTPVFFVAGKGIETENERPGPNFTGVLYKADLRPSLRIALSLQPGLRRVFVITGASVFDQHYEEGAKDQWREFEGRLAFTYSSGQPLDELKQTVSHLPADCAIAYVTMVEDRFGNRFLQNEVLAQISQAASVPIYGFREPEMQYGILGGSLVSFDKIFQQAAPVALRVLRGDRVEDVPVTEVFPNVVEFNWRQLQRFKISEDSLPSGSQVRFKELTFWEQYKWYIVGVLSLCALETVLIAALLLERGRRQRAKAALDRLNTELEGRVSDRTSALAAKTRELETFAYSVAHDLKAPLRGIDGYSRLLLEDYMDKLDEDGRSILYTIRSSTNEMSKLIEDLLAYSRLEQREMASTRVELRPLVESLVEKKRNELGEHKVEFTLNVNGGAIVADADGLAQALRNYLDNAVKFTCDASEPRIEIGAEETDEDCRLWVRDNGVGFDMKYRDKIFEIFTRLHRDEEYAGTGIGLAIVRKAAERMKGRAWAESSPGMGATFYLEIPKGVGRSNGCASRNNHG